MTDWINAQVDRINKEREAKQLLQGAITKDLTPLWNSLTKALTDAIQEFNTAWPGRKPTLEKGIEGDIFRVKVIGTSVELRITLVRNEPRPDKGVTLFNAQGLHYWHQGLDIGQRLMALCIDESGSLRLQLDEKAISEEEVVATLLAPVLSAVH